MSDLDRAFYPVVSSSSAACVACCGQPRTCQRRMDQTRAWKACFPARSSAMLHIAVQLLPDRKCARCAAWPAKTTEETCISAYLATACACSCIVHCTRLQAVSSPTQPSPQSPRPQLEKHIAPYAASAAVQCLGIALIAAVAWRPRGLLLLSATRVIRSRARHASPPRDRRTHTA